MGYKYEVGPSTFSGKMFTNKADALNYAAFLLSEPKINEVMIRKY